MFGEAGDVGTLRGAFAHAGYHALNFVFLYVCAALLIRGRRR